MKRKSIKIEESGNLKFFHIYAVRAQKHDGEVITHDRYLNEKDANASLAFVNEHLSELYCRAWVRDFIVWC